MKRIFRVLRGKRDVLAPETARVVEAMALHELGVQMYRQRMCRENPQASQSEIDAMVRAWLAEPPRG